jgi:HPt (histidine-containing phosphotransfer) domain-containing protein
MQSTTSQQFQLNHEYLVSYYGEMVNETTEIFEAFIEETPFELAQVNEEVNKFELRDAADRLHKISPSFSSVGIPQLTLKIQQAEAFLRQGNAKVATEILENVNKELNDFMPAILNEYKRVKNYGEPA